MLRIARLHATEILDSRARPALAVTLETANGLRVRAGVHANAFVGGFIGPPAMNLFRLPITTDGTALGGLFVPLPRPTRRAAGDENSAEIVLGVRSEQFEILSREDLETPDWNSWSTPSKTLAPSRICIRPPRSVRRPYRSPCGHRDARRTARGNRFASPSTRIPSMSSRRRRSSGCRATMHRPEQGQAGQRRSSAG
jgi:hypothetical protein